MGSNFVGDTEENRIGALLDSHGGLKGRDHLRVGLARS
jgi:hypothetical protein